MLRSPAVVIFSLTCSVFTVAQPACATPSNVVRTDLANRRLFVVAQLESIDAVKKARSLIKPLAEYIRACEPKWGNEWRISFFSDPQVATYKTDIEEKQSSRFKDWASAYIGEYENRAKKLHLYPLSAKKAKWLAL